jgi:hypothetical protein
MENKNNLLFATQQDIEEILSNYGIVVSSDEANLRFLDREYPNGTIVLLNDRYYIPVYTNGDREVFDITYMFESYL